MTKKTMITDTTGNVTGWIHTHEDGKSVITDKTGYPITCIIPSSDNQQTSLNQGTYSRSSSPCRGKYYLFKAVVALVFVTNLAKYLFNFNPNNSNHACIVLGISLIIAVFNWTKVLKNLWKIIKKRK